MMWGWMSMVLEGMGGSGFCRVGIAERAHADRRLATRPRRARRCSGGHASLCPRYHLHLDSGCCFRGHPLVETAVDLAGIALEDLVLVLGREPAHLVDVALGVVVVVAGVRVDALDGADHL